LIRRTGIHATRARGAGLEADSPHRSLRHVCIEPARQHVIPGLRYRDAQAAIDWLCKAFGFVQQAVHEDEHGRLEHAQLTWGNGMIMLSEVRVNDFGRHIAQPDEIGGRETQCACVIVDHYAEKAYGGAGCSCRDPERHLWHFGSYDPWRPE
jgi:uncharacterized glyoxalase superfamily protein PhnB